MLGKNRNLESVEEQNINKVLCPNYRHGTTNAYHINSLPNYMKNQLKNILAAGSILVGTFQAFAAPVNITIADFNPGAGFGTGPTGIGAEDQETEPGTIGTQAWDMEAFVVNGSTLYIVGGYNMRAGEAGGGGSVVPGYLTPGDLFIKVGGSQPGFNPSNQGAGDVNNAGYQYSYAIDLTQPVGATGATAQVYSLNSSSIFNTVVYDQFGANPWKYSSGGTAISSRVITYTSGLADGAAALVNLGLGGLLGGSHNILSIDLGFLNVAANTPVYFSYTMECGNDSLKGSYSGGFDKVPDSSASLGLIAVGLLSVAVFGYKRRKA